MPDQLLALVSSGIGAGIIARWLCGEIASILRLFVDLVRSF